MLQPFVKLVWKPSLFLAIADDNNIILQDEYNFWILTGKPYISLLKHLDDSDGVIDLAKRCAGQASMPELMLALHLLKEEGHVVESPRHMSRADAAFWASVGAGAIQKIEQAPSLTVSAEKIGANSSLRDQLLHALRGSGLTIGEPGEARLHLVITDDYLRPELSLINKEHLEQKKPWMLIKPVGNEVWVGPIFEPGYTGCWDCLAQRLKSNRQIETYLISRNGDGAKRPLPTSFAAFQPVVSLAMNLAALEVAKFLASSDYSRLRGCVVSFDALSLETRTHSLTRRPQCVACGEPKVCYTAPRPVVMESAAKRFVRDGGHRMLTPEETYAKYKNHISHITGVVTWLKELTGDVTNGMTYSYAAGHDFALMGKTLDFLLHNLRGRSGGKGASDVQARVSAIGEAIERYSGVYRGEEISQCASYAELGFGDAIHPNELMCFSDQQYLDRERFNRENESEYHIVPEKFDERRTIHWTPVWSLTEERHKLIPSAYCFYGHPDLRSHFLCPCDANGAAAGNSVAEAILQGFIELVERDCVAQWWYNRVRRPGVDLSSFADSYFDRLPDVYRKINREFWVLDITADLGIPTFAAVSRRTDRNVQDIILGFGAHFDARLGIMRALTEVNQFLPVVSDNDPEGRTIYKFHDAEAIRWWQTETLDSQPYLKPSQVEAARTAADYTDLSSADLKQDVETCVGIAKRAGLETLVLDQTQPDIGLSVVKVFVPGLRHFWKRFGPGRLYDIPVKLGWCAQPTPEAELNPTGIFF